MHGPPPVLLRPPQMTNSRHDGSPTEPNVLSRLSALFNANLAGPNASSDGFQDLERSKTEPIIPVSPQLSPGTFVDRHSIKVLVVTWNMGDALPKGDLSVLLGDVPHYVPESPTDHLPTLPHGNLHPYHIVVVAGQECPTHSGVPRGLGGGLMKGVHVRGAHRKEKEDKKRREEEEAAAGGSGATTVDEAGLRTPGLNVDSDEDEDDSRVGTPVASSPNQPALHKHMHNPGSKGWSTMLDDWFCGPSGRKEEPIFPSSGEVTSPGGGSPSSTNPPLAIPMPPSLIRSSSAPGAIVSPTKPLLIPPDRDHAAAMSHSPLARSISSSASSSSSADSFKKPSYLIPTQPASPDLRPKAATLPGQKPRPEIIIPNDEPERTRDGEKCYLHLVKERLMGMYLSVYVYKGCEHLVQGVDKDFVTAGLAGGRVGNKGGIGISLKLADHRFLFVNSHLAAHTARVGARLANIEKIKSELRLDCFLPKDDPRFSLEDLTDRFDSVFWCGDLNFRLDLSRLHAEWLVEQKKYDEALMWDQLKAVMRDPQKNPLPGFQEGIIDFPPTFKYDVWRSIKATNRDLRRSIRRRGTLDGKSKRPGAIDAPSATSGAMGLSHVPEAGSHEELGEAFRQAHGEDPRHSDDDTRTMASRRSIDSNGGGYTSAGPSTAGTDADDNEDYSTSVDASAYGSRHKALEVALKEKTKHFLSFVKMDKVLSPSPSRRKLGRSGSRKVKEKQSQDFDYNSRRTSVSSMASLEPPMPISEPLPVGQPSTSSNRSNAESLGFAPPRRPSDASWASTSPNQPMIRRRFSVLKRTVSSRSSNNDGKSGDSHEQLDDIDETIDQREGVYDTSKKQRVPSWCDRVLWKSIITPDVEPRPPTPPHDDVHDKGHRPFSRISNAFSNLGGHLRLSVTRTGSVDPHDRPNLHFSNSNPSHVHDRPLPPTPPPEPQHNPISSDPQEFVTSPAGSPSLQSSATLHDDTTVPLPKRSPSRVTALPLRLTIRTRSGSATHPLLDANSVLASPPAHPKITFDPALPADSDRSEVLKNRPRSNSDGLNHDITKRAMSSSSDYSALVSPVREMVHRRSSGGSLRSKARTASVDPVNSRLAPSLPSIATTSVSAQPSVTRPTIGQQNSGTSTITTSRYRPSIGNTHWPGHGEDKNAFVKFIKDIPGWLHVRSSPHPEPAQLPPPSAPDFGPKRHARGEVVCLHYGTIDDAGMRQLEGRSDHRPAIFAAAVYVGD